MACRASTLRSRRCQWILKKRPASSVTSLLSSLDVSIAERIIEPPHAMVVVDTPLICMIDGVQAQHFSGTGVVVYHSETMRTVAVDRYTVPVSISDTLLPNAENLQHICL